MSRILVLLFVFSFVSIYADSAVFDHNVRGNDISINGSTTPYQTIELPGADIVSASGFAVPPVITLTGIASGSRFAQLSWTATPPPLDGIFYVERDVASSGAWAILKQLPYNAVLQYNDTISSPYCTSTDFSYRIRFEGSVPGDAATSNISDLLLWDQTNPVNVKDIIVSISNSHPLVSWQQVTGDSISGYEINRFNGFSWQPILPAMSSDSSSYLDIAVLDGCDKSYTYEIIVIDQCNNRSVPGYTPKHTIKLDLPPIDECERLAKLSWNAYTLMPGGLGGYRVYREDNGVIVEIANLTDTLLTSYNDDYTFENGHNYIYYVQAYSASGSGISTSCREGSAFIGASIPILIYSTNVSVENNSYIRISYFSSPIKTVKTLILERSDDGITFQAIDSLSVPGDFVPQESFFEDKTADPNSQSYFYRLKTIDYCGTNILISNISRSVYLQCTSSSTQNTIDWNTYQSWLKGVEGYKIYRTVDGQPTAGELLGSVTPVTQSYPDPLTGIDPTRQVCYWVVAAENPGNPYLANATSLSNTCCIVKGATLFMPNAFRPTGINNRFRPVATFVDPQKFKMTLFSRWGQQFFETTDMVNGWDGTINGNIAPHGLYVYIITYTSYGGQVYTQRGTVYVVK